jgi:hypothetical protein
MSGTSQELPDALLQPGVEQLDGDLGAILESAAVHGPEATLPVHHLPLQIHLHEGVHTPVGHHPYTINQNRHHGDQTNGSEDQTNGLEDQKNRFEQGHRGSKHDRPAGMVTHRIESARRQSCDATRRFAGEEDDGVGELRLRGPIIHGARETTEPRRDGKCCRWWWRHRRAEVWVLGVGDGERTLRKEEEDGDGRQCRWLSRRRKMSRVAHAIEMETA